MTAATQIPIIIVSYRNPEDVVGSLRALQRSAATPCFDVYLCENGGADAFDDLIAALTDPTGPCENSTAWSLGNLPMPRFVRLHSLQLRGRDARVLVAQAAENFGYAGAINAWLRALLGAGPWIGAWILNPDTEPEPLALAELVAWSATRSRGMVGCRIVAPSKREIVHTRGLQWRPVRATTRAVDHRALATIEPDPEELEGRLDAPSGSSMYVTRNCLESIGLMDERYFLYFEDLDWGVRAKRSEKIGYAHNSVVPHRGGTTIGSGRSRSEASQLSVYLDVRNRLLFVRQHYPIWVAWTVVALFGRSLEYGMVGAFGNLRAALAGLRAGIAGETGRPDRLFEFGAGPPRMRSAAGLSMAATAKRKTKIIISVGFHLVTLAGCFLDRLSGRAARDRLVILYYHSVPPELRARFARQLDILAARATVVPVDSCSSNARGRHNVAITFDDAFTSVLDNALPELRTRGMPATIFVPMGSLGRPPAWEMEDEWVDGGSVVATADALRSMTSELVQLGAHSLTHPHLTRLRLEDARLEIAGCREQMEIIFGTKIRHFAFPYGDHDSTVIELCRDAGYERVYTNIPRTVDPSSDEFVRGRVSVDPTDGTLEFSLKMSGAYAWMAQISAWKKWLKAQLPWVVRRPA
jgi:GT2 family glycosyltransferase/peptidoglycan/xylan/chitin deacetylase (PgdA/CDA1 family)